MSKTVHFASSVVEAISFELFLFLFLMYVSDGVSCCLLCHTFREYFVVVEHLFHNSLLLLLIK